MDFVGRFRFEVSGSKEKKAVCNVFKPFVYKDQEGQPLRRLGFFILSQQSGEDKPNRFVANSPN